MSNPASQVRPCPHCSGTGKVEIVGDLTDAQRAEIANHLRYGRLVDAIKDYRKYAGCSLREAKDAVEAMQEGRWNR